ncbi:MAG: LptA/OstA family protein [Kiritimatiellia bacterium]
MKKFILLLLFTCLHGLSLISVQAQQPAELNVEADQLDFENEKNTVTARGNVLLRKGAQSLKADVVTYNTVTEQAFARGNVVFTNQDQIWRGETLQYNFITGKGSFPDLEMQSEPFTLNAGSLDRISPVQSQMRDVTITTCPIPVDPEFYISASKVDVYDESIFVLRNPVFHLRGIPFFYLPRLTLDQERKPTNIDVIPGYGSRNGASLLTSYNRYPSDSYRTKTHLDYRSERGPALGQDFFWFEPGNHLANLTSLKLYGMIDDAPYRDENQEIRLRNQGIDVEEERYRVQFRHRQQISSTDSLWANASYLSDARIVEEFFREEFREEPIPENRLIYNSIGDNWNANIELNRQLNDDDFSSVNRLPEASLNMPMRQLETIDLLYEGSTRAGFMERTFSTFDRDGGEEDFDSLRFHTDHMLFYPTRHFGWLNVIPRAGGRVTYYSDTRRTETRVVPVSTTDENNIITTTFEEETFDVAESADTRILPELGFETSFKAFGIVHEQPTGLGRGLRHVVEPFSDYTFIPEPDLTPENIYQFDRIDRLGEEHNLAFGVRNKWQTRKVRNDAPPLIHDLVNMAVSTEYDLRSDADPALGNIRVDTELRLVEWARARIDFRYDSDEGELNTVDTQLKFENPESKSWISLDQRFRIDDTHTLQFTYKLNPLGKLGFEGYTRYELEDEGFEEQDVMFTYETDCVGYGVGGRWIKGDTYLDGTRDDDDFEVWLQIWLTAFPRAILGSKGR